MQNYKNHKVDLSNCDSEPIHIIGRIQPHGFLIILNSSSLIVEQLSENVEYYLGVKPEVLFGKTLDTICSAEEYQKLEKQLRNDPIISPQLVTIRDKHFFGFAHLSANKIILECEAYTPTDEYERLENYCSFSHFQSKINTLYSLESLSELLVNFVQEYLNYDRVLLYVFDKEWNGEVIAEKTKPGIGSYLYQHFPSSDIPAPARDLLTKKPIRQIPDISASAIDIVPYVNLADGAPTNIIQSELRNASEIHLEYLANMGVQASLSITLMVKGKLWGLITCHHQSPKFVDFWKRQMCYMASKTFSAAVLTNQEKRDLQTLAYYKQMEEVLVEQVNATGSVSKGLFKQHFTLLDITESQGAAIYIENTLTTTGNTPAADQVMEIIEWLIANNNASIFYTRELSKHIPQADAYRQNASGLLALEISRYNKSYILFFKPEIKETRIWAGNPEKPIAGDGMRVHPRKSFSKWVEDIRGKSVPWTMNELEVTQLLLKDMVAILLRNHADKLKELNDELLTKSEELKVKNNRLEDFAYIITHNLRSPLSNIRGLYAHYQASPNQETGSEVMGRMNLMINNMSDTIDDLNTILKTANEQQLQQEAVSVADVINKEKQNILTEPQAEITTELFVTQLNIPKVYIESIVHNLLSNALKYSSPDRKPIIKVKTWLEHDKLYLTVSDNGLGMNLNKMGHKLFGLYKTFHRNKDSKGLGLYLTRMQVEALGGKISAESEPDKGTTFTVELSASLGCSFNVGP
ncbi:ATP-binding protein [Pontibacter silvestris]|uniref:histidine kinase n=1 Tax=Pontibacter silvestris TaxID=2305183 RepID=A0ABW4WUC6_9BACT|nr:ATP-binding protein [Pontibacter silvestris]MCC9137711.1 GAF domain-containing protein [Pontibacter silvestris]